MQYYFAPLEGLTDSIYRKVHHKYFPGLDRYYTPFLSPTAHRALTNKEKREIPPAGTLDHTVIPQILTKNAEDFLWAAQVCADRGYGEVNLNLGCPSGTVVAKGKGSGMLKDVQLLVPFLDQIYAKTPIKVSIKTRLGMEDPAEFPAILSALEQFPVAELTIHPRVRKQFYDGKVHMESFRYAVDHSSLPLCYNGDLCSRGDIDAFRQEFPQIQAVMIGRGLIGDPGMLTKTDVKTLEAFHNDLLEEYTAAFGGSRNAMFRLKENWHFLIEHFENSEKLWKKLRKTTDIGEFKSITAQIFHTLPLK